MNVVTGLVTTTEGRPATGAHRARAPGWVLPPATHLPLPRLPGRPASMFLPYTLPHNTRSGL